ncbi:MAG: hypothetical protein H6825_05740 [Planctomycetes bacterium]|nr:hypothetical protein [Planctomycetota bacterium]
MPTFVLALLCAMATEIPDGSVAVVTGDGLWLVLPSPPQVAALAAPSDFGLPGGLREPSVTSIPGSDSLLVTSRADPLAGTPGALFRVSVGPASSLEIVDLAQTILVDPTPDFVDADVSRGLDTAFLLDGQGRVFTLADPAHADGASLGLFAAVPIESPRSVAVDTSKWPLGAVVLGRLEARRVIAGGASVQVLDAGDDGSWRDTECNPLTSEVYFASAGGDDFGKVLDGLLASGNAWGSCTHPVKQPLDLDWDAGTNKYVVLAGGGVDCLFGGVAQGFPNHVVRMPFAQIVGPGPIPPGAEPALLTPPGDTGITGADGDLALVRQVAPETVFFGEPGVSGAGKLPKFDNAGYQGGFRPGKTVFVQLVAAPAHAPALLVLGFTLSSLPFQGQHLYPSLDLLVPVTTDAAGKASISFKMPPTGALAGTPLFLQWWIDDVTTSAPGDLVGSHGAIAVLDD